MVESWGRRRIRVIRVGVERCFRVLASARHMDRKPRNTDRKLIGLDLKMAGRIAKRFIWIGNRSIRIKK